MGERGHFSWLTPPDFRPQIPAHQLIHTSSRVHSDKHTHPRAQTQPTRQRIKLLLKQKSKTDRPDKM